MSLKPSTLAGAGDELDMTVLVLPSGCLGMDVIQVPTENRFTAERLLKTLLGKSILLQNY